MKELSSLKDKMGLNDGLIYLNHASIGPLPKSSHDVLYAENLKQMQVAEEKIFYDQIEILWDNLRSNCAEMVNGKPEGITITTNTASSLHIVADCLYNRFKVNKNIVIPDIEFVTNSYIWQQIVKRYHLELRTIKMSSTEDYYDQWEKQIDDNTVLVALSHVQFGTGFRSDLKRISQIAHAHGALVCIDAIQSLGAIPFDVESNDVDFVAAAGYKWMLSPLMSGMLYVRPELLDNLESILVGWFSTPNFRKLGHNEFEPWSDARKFQQSMINPVWNSFNQSLNELISWGISETFNTIIKLQDQIISEIEDHQNFSIESSLKNNERSGILRITSNQNTKKLVEHLGSKQITVAYREGGIRISPHGYNDKSDIDRLLEVLINWKFNN